MGQRTKFVVDPSSPKFRDGTRLHKSALILCNYLDLAPSIFAALDELQHRLASKDEADERAVGEVGLEG